MGREQNSAPLKHMQNMLLILIFADGTTPKTFAKMDNEQLAMMIVHSELKYVAAT